MSERFPVVSGAVFDSDSPLRRIPHDLDPTQRRYLQGVRFAIEMTQLSSARLRELLTDITVSGTFPAEAWPAPSASIFLDAWSMVDSLHRLRELLATFPNMKKNVPLLKVFNNETSGVTGLRHHIQHLRNLGKADQNYIPVWGAVGWIWTVDDTLTRFKLGVITAGADSAQLRPILKPGGRSYHDQLDHITIQAGTYKVNLSEAMRQTIHVARAFESVLEPQFDGCEPLPLVDSLMLCEFVFPSEAPDESDDQNGTS